LYGDKNAAKKVLQLCDWIRCFYNGSDSIADRSFRLLTIDFKQNALTNIGLKAPGFKYPLDRGIGNFLMTLLDAYDIRQDKGLLSEAGSVIKNTVHPNEDLTARDLKNIEERWFYTVFLQALIRYLFVKESVGSIDADYWYARNSLLHYGRWMLINETFYLDKPEELEIPNDTWCAQEVRKANIMFYCYFFEEQDNSAFLDKAKEIYAYIESRLHSSREKSYTRVLAILMQNDGVYQKFNTGEANLDSSTRSRVTFVETKFGSPPKQNALKILARYIKDVFKILGRFSIAREIHWLKIRLGRL
jgi:hypothetical protein